MRDVMLDLETFGTKPGCALRSIGAVFFDLADGLGQEFYMNVDVDSCRAEGLHIDPKTEAWWADQSAKAQEAMLVDPQPLGVAIDAFNNFFRAFSGLRLWCQGANFDAPIFEAAAAACDRRTPWQFYNVRDTRTAYELYGFDYKNFKRAGTYHNALDDAKHQAAALIAASSLYVRSGVVVVKPGVTATVATQHGGLFE